jgi:hypothetical protein
MNKDRIYVGGATLEPAATAYQREEVGLYFRPAATQEAPLPAGTARTLHDATGPFVLPAGALLESVTVVPAPFDARASFMADASAPARAALSGAYIMLTRAPVTSLAPLALGPGRDVRVFATDEVAGGADTIGYVTDSCRLPLRPDALQQGQYMQVYSLEPGVAPIANPAGTETDAFGAQRAAGTVFPYGSSAADTAALVSARTVLRGTYGGATAALTRDVGLIVVYKIALPNYHKLDADGSIVGGPDERGEWLT